MIRAAPSRRRVRQTIGQMFLWPALIALATAAGLILALTGDGWRDVLGAALIASSLAAMVHGWRRRG
jgi:uncharacterized membrane protein YjjP (DUF1212 family)